MEKIKTGLAAFGMSDKYSTPHLSVQTQLSA